MKKKPVNKVKKEDCPNCMGGKSSHIVATAEGCCALCGDAGVYADRRTARAMLIDGKIQETRKVLRAYSALVNVDSPTRAMLLPRLVGLVEAIRALEAMPLDDIPLHATE